MSECINKFNIWFECLRSHLILMSFRVKGIRYHCRRQVSIIQFCITKGTKINFSTVIRFFFFFVYFRFFSFIRHKAQWPIWFFVLPLRDASEELFKIRLCTRMRGNEMLAQMQLYFLLFFRDLILFGYRFYCFVKFIYNNIFQKCQFQWFTIIVYLLWDKKKIIAQD